MKKAYEESLKQECTFAPKTNYAGRRSLYPIPEDKPTNLQEKDDQLKHVKVNCTTDVFDYLAKRGAKKAEDLAKMKQERDLASCTFKPQINKEKASLMSRSKSVSEAKFLEQQKEMKEIGVHEKLAMPKKRYDIETEKLAQEMKDCTFNPNLNQKSRKMVKNNETGESHYEKLYKKHQEKMKKVQSMAALKKDTELDQCTFAPQVNHKTKLLA